MSFLNKVQKKIIIIGATTIIICCFFPPWIHTFNAKGIYSEESAGYSLLTTPPVKKRDNVRFGVKLDISRLLLQIFMISITTGVGVFILKDK